MLVLHGYTATYFHNNFHQNLAWINIFCVFLFFFLSST
jgi:hypothetical protein